MGFVQFEKYLVSRFGIIEAICAWRLEFSVTSAKKQFVILKESFRFGIAQSTHRCDRFHE